MFRVCLNSYQATAPCYKISIMPLRVAVTKPLVNTCTHTQTIVKPNEKIIYVRGVNEAYKITRRTQPQQNHIINAS